MSPENLIEKVENYRDAKWRREDDLKIEFVQEAERMIEELGFCAALTDARTKMPSLYIAVCGRRDAFAPRNVQKDVEMSLAWTLKDEILRRGKVFYAKLGKSRTLFVAPRLIGAFNCLFGVERRIESRMLSKDALKILEVLNREFESASADLRKETEISERSQFNKALDELQQQLRVMPSDVIYQPKFTYIWTLTEARFPIEMKQKITREKAITEIARAYLGGAAQT
ncbi:MAG: hypothetical protein H7Z37_08660, partial [Pyrinomonadaceae bacterium]|nr:hypothetical protein [Pyrinomonadaceae bacterium]